MNTAAIVKAKRAALEFLKSCDDLALYDLECKAKGYPEWNIHGCAQSGTVRRKSMDLTRALAALRRPN